MKEGLTEHPSRGANQHLSVVGSLNKAEHTSRVCRPLDLFWLTADSGVYTSGGRRHCDSEVLVLRTQHNNPVKGYLESMPLDAILVTLIVIRFLRLHYCLWTAGGISTQFFLWLDNTTGISPLFSPKEKIEHAVVLAPLKDRKLQSTIHVNVFLP